MTRDGATIGLELELSAVGSDTRRPLIVRLQFYLKNVKRTLIFAAVNHKPSIPDLAQPAVFKYSAYHRFRVWPAPILRSMRAPRAFETKLIVALIGAKYAVENCINVLCVIAQIKFFFYLSLTQRGAHFIIRQELGFEIFIIFPNLHRVALHQPI